MVPRSPAFAPAAPELARALSAAIPSAGAIERLESDGSAAGAGRFFRTACGPTGAPLFLKLMSESEQRAVAGAEAIIASLPSGGSAVRSCGVFGVADGSRRVVVAYPYVDARFLGGAPPDMRLLGREIAVLHRLLRSLSGGAQIQTRARERALRLDATLANAARFQDLLAAADISGPAPSIADAIDRKGAQPLHGDLNVGNILLERGTGAIRFLDFEDVRHSFGAPLLDLALPIERFCLLLEDDEDAAAAAAALLRAYAEEFGAPPVSRAGDLLEALRIVNWRAIALLIERRQAGLETPKSEWRKFGALLGRHAERRELIAAIEQASL